MFSIWNSCLLHRLRMGSKWISSFYLIILHIHTNLSSFNQNMANVKMQDAYYLEKILKGTGSIIIIANDNTTSYLLFFLSVAIRWVSETGYYNFINSFLILAVLFLLFTAPVFDKSNFGRRWTCISLEIPTFEEKQCNTTKFTYITLA